MTSKFRNTRYKAEDVPSFFRKTKVLKRRVCNFNISNQINNGKLYDPLTNEAINLDAEINNGNAPIVIKGDTCPRIYSKQSIKNLIKEASKKNEFAKNPFTRNIVKSMGPPPLSVINYVKNKLSS